MPQRIEQGIPPDSPDKGATRDLCRAQLDVIFRVVMPGNCLRVTAVPIPMVENMALENDLLRILACPACRGELDRADGDEGLICPACAKVYPIREDIPVMLGEEAISLLEWRNGKREATGSRLPASDPASDSA